MKTDKFVEQNKGQINLTEVKRKFPIFLGLFCNFLSSSFKKGPKIVLCATFRGPQKLWRPDLLTKVEHFILNK
jgi:hypothetical protein